MTHGGDAVTHGGDGVTHGGDTVTDGDGEPVTVHSGEAEDLTCAVRKTG